MRRLILKMSMTMDGFVGGPEGELHWLFPTLDVEAKRWIADTISEAGVHIMGSRTYADMAAYWPASKDVLAAPMNDIPKVVFSRSGTFATSQALDDAKRLEPIAASSASWGPPRVASGELASEIARLKAEPGKAIFAHGGARFARSLVASRLIDEYQLLVHPVALGRGQPLFSDLAEPLTFERVSTTPFPSGAVAHVLRPIR